MQNTVTDLPESTDMKSDEDDDVGDIIHRVVQIQNIPLFRNYTTPMRDISDAKNYRENRPRKTTAGAPNAGGVG